MATTPKAIGYISPGDKTTIFHVYTSDDATVDTNWTAAQSGALSDSTPVAYGVLYNPAILNATNTAIVGGTVSATTGAIPNTATQLVDKTTSLTLANGANSNIASAGLSNFARIIGPTGAFSISGFASGADGATLTIWNSTSQAMTITNNATSTAANRIITGTGADVVVSGNGAVQFTYSASDARWLCTGLSEGATGTGTVTSFSAGTTGFSVATATTTPVLSGTLIVANGGTGVATAAAHGVMIGEGTSAMATTAAGTATQVLQSGGASADPVWSTATFPATTTANQLLYSSATNTVGGLATAANAVLSTDSSSVPTLNVMGKNLVARNSGNVTNATTSLADVTGLGFAVAANEVWSFHVSLSTSSPDANGIKLGFTFPAAATFLARCLGTTTGVTAFSVDSIAASATAGLAFNTVNAATGVIEIDGTYVGGANAGTVQLQFLKATSGTGTILANSSLRATRLA